MTNGITSAFGEYCKIAERNGVRPYDGNCLELAIGLALALEEQGKHPEVVLLLRDDEFDPTAHILSHAVVRFDGVDIDASGFQATQRWIDQFNQTQRLNGDEEVTFYEEGYTEKFMSLYRDCRTRFNMQHASEDVVNVTREIMKSELGNFLPANEETT